MVSVAMQDIFGKPRDADVARLFDLVFETDEATSPERVRAIRKPRPERSGQLSEK